MLSLTRPHLYIVWVGVSSILQALIWWCGLGRGVPQILLNGFIMSCPLHLVIIWIKLVGLQWIDLFVTLKSFFLCCAVKDSVAGWTSCMQMMQQWFSSFVFFCPIYPLSIWLESANKASIFRQDLWIQGGGVWPCQLMRAMHLQVQIQGLQHHP